MDTGNFDQKGNMSPSSGTFCKIPPRKTITVLYVDDEFSLLDIAKMFLEQKGEISLTIASSALQALKILETTSFDVIISDYQMPRMNGIMLLKHLQERHDPTPFFLFTGRGREEIVIEAINNGATYYIQKGGNPEAQFAELEHKIKEAARRRHAEEALKESEARYRTLFENSGTAIIITRQNSIITLANAEFCRISGFSYDEICNRKSWMDFILPEDRERLIHEYRSALYNPDAAEKQFEFRLLTRSGEIRNILLTEGIIPGTDQSVGSLIDITARVQAETALNKKSEELLDAYAKLEDAEEELIQQYGSLVRDYEREVSQKNVNTPDTSSESLPRPPHHMLNFFHFNDM